VRIGANESTSLYLLPEVILAFREKHPQVKVEIYRHASDLLPREVLDRNVDFALMAFEPNDRDLDAFPVLKDELVLILNAKHALASRDSVSIKELGKESFLAHNVKTASRLKVIEAFARQHTPLNIHWNWLRRDNQALRAAEYRFGICAAHVCERGVRARHPG
jgi:DNA-binding transcriptional LysR family regulator